MAAQSLAYVYGHADPRDAGTAKALTLDEARRMQLEPIISDLKGRGYSMARIAAELNKQGVATPRGGRWDYSSVRNVINRLVA